MTLHMHIAQCLVNRDYTLGFRYLPIYQPETPISDRGLITDISVPSIAISDHYLVCFTRSMSKINYKRQSHKSIQYRCYKKFNKERFLTDLSESLNSVNLSNSGSDHNFKTWTTSLISAFNKHAPLKTKRVKHETQPDWINGDIKSAMKNRDTNHKLNKTWWPYWSCDPTHLYKFSFPFSLKLSYERRFQIAQLFLRKTSFYFEKSELPLIKVKE